LHAHPFAVVHIVLGLVHMPVHVPFLHKKEPSTSPSPFAHGSLQVSPSATGSGQPSIAFAGIGNSAQPRGARLRSVAGAREDRTHTPPLHAPSTHSCELAMM